jgi:hypothetical protein
MFHKLFEREHALIRHRSAPLASERRSYLIHLATQGVALATLKVVAHYLLAITERLRLSDRPERKIGLKEIKRCAGSWGCRNLAMPITQPSISRRRFIRQATRWLRFMGRLELPLQSPKPYARQVALYEAYMQQEQGLSPCTIAYGHVHLAATQVYLSMTPELLNEANQRFERYAEKKSQNR